MAENEEWSTNANDAVKLSLVQPGSDTERPFSTFKPTFTYPIFGDEELIFGYQGLKIDIKFATNDLKPNVDISFDKKFKPVGETKAADVEGILRKWLPASAFKDPKDFAKAVKDDGSKETFTPPGKLVTTYRKGSKNFEVWSGNLSDPAVQAILRRLQFFVPLFIEAGSYIELNDPEWTLDRWQVFFLYEKLAASLTPKSTPYSIAGFCTTYRNFLVSRLMPKPSITFKTQLPFPAESIPTASSLPCRQRISQFLILPPYQEHGHGASLYKIIYKTLLYDPTVLEITVEDPSEKFDDLRDYCDLEHLHSVPEFTKIQINTAVSVPKKGRLPTAKLIDVNALEAVRISQKLAPRQFSRLTEMHLLSTVPSSSRSSSSADSALNALRAKRDPSTAEADKLHRYWQLLTKQRIYKHNKDQLMQLDRLDRIDKLAETLGMLEADYIRLLTRFERGPSTKERQEKELNANGKGASQEEKDEVRAERAKRKLVLDDDEDMEDQGGSDGSGRDSKRAKQ